MENVSLAMYTLILLTVSVGLLLEEEFYLVEHRAGEQTLKCPSAVILNISNVGGLVYNLSISQVCPQACFTASYSLLTYYTLLNHCQA